MSIGAKDSLIEIRLVYLKHTEKAFSKIRVRRAIFLYIHEQPLSYRRYVVTIIPAEEPGCMWKPRLKFLV